MRRFNLSLEQSHDGHGAVGHHIIDIAQQQHIVDNYPSLITSVSLSKLTNNHRWLSLVGISLSPRRKGGAQNISLCHWRLASVSNSYSIITAVHFVIASIHRPSSSDLDIIVCFFSPNNCRFFVTSVSLGFARVVSSHSVQQHPLICLPKHHADSPHGACSACPLLYISLSHFLLRHLLSINEFGLCQNESLVRCCWCCPSISTVMFRYFINNNVFLLVILLRENQWTHHVWQIHFSRNSEVVSVIMNYWILLFFTR